MKPFWIKHNILRRVLAALILPFVPFIGIVVALVVASAEIYNDTRAVFLIAFGKDAAIERNKCE